MTRSTYFAAYKVLLDPARVREADVEGARPWAAHWATWAAATFLRAYCEAARGSGLLPLEPAQAALLFDAFVLERELHQLRVLLEDGADAIISLLGIESILASR
jgi:predicted trehalose synthase